MRLLFMAFHGAWHRVKGTLVFTVLKKIIPDARQPKDSETSTKPLALVLATHNKFQHCNRHG
jgi:hypothetical protein